MIRRFLAAIVLLTAFAAPARSSMNAEFEYQLDAYYTAADLYVNFSTSAIPYYDNKSEWDVYRKLFLSSPIPRTLTLEASVNPLPLAGVWIRRQAPRFYDDAQISDDTNLVESVTAGFEEPAALSVFLGNVIDFKPVKKRRYAEGKGYMGYLISVGNRHIKDSELIHDNWVETEVKVKGDRRWESHKLQWSFRIGAKHHENRNIADVIYVGLRRSRVDYESGRFFWLNNTGYMYKFDANARSFSAVQHHFLIDKKFPLKNRKMVPTLAVGFLWRARDKYRGSLRTEESGRFQVLVQPNLEF